jgi:hypothetical protein
LDCGGSTPLFSSHRRQLASDFKLVDYVPERYAEVAKTFAPDSSR